MGSSVALIAYGVWQNEPSFIAMGIGVLGAPSISVVVAKDPKEVDADETV